MFRLTVLDLARAKSDVKREEWCTTESHVSYCLALLVLSKALGQEWTTRNTAKDAYLGIPEPSEIDQLTYLRTVRLGHLIFSLQFLDGFEERLEDLRTKDLESVQGELETMVLMTEAGVDADFVKPQGKRGEDFDILIHPPAGEDVSCEIKTKAHQAEFSAKALVRDLKKKCSQMPEGKPGIIVLKIPDSWPSQISSDPEEFQQGLDSFFRGTSRVAGVVFAWDEFTDDGVSGLGTRYRCERNLCSPHYWHVAQHVFDPIDSSLASPHLLSFALPESQPSVRVNCRTGLTWMAKLEAHVGGTTRADVLVLRAREQKLTVALSLENGKNLFLWTRDSSDLVWRGHVTSIDQIEGLAVASVSLRWEGKALVLRAKWRGASATFIQELNQLAGIEDLEFELANEPIPPLRTPRNVRIKRAFWSDGFPQGMALTKAERMMETDRL